MPMNESRVEKMKCTPKAVWSSAVDGSGGKDDVRAVRKNFQEEVSEMNVGDGGDITIYDSTETAQTGGTGLE